MTIIATIHQPSAPIFFLFDRVIVLSEGYCIYNGTPAGVKDYFSKLGLIMSRYSNPADKLSVIASEPRKLLNKNISIIELDR